MKIIVTGGSGMVGSNFIHFMSKKNITLLSVYYSNPTNFNYCDNHKIDIVNKEAVLNLKKFNPDIIIHCAAITNIAFCEENPRIAYNVNVKGTKNLIELAKITQAIFVYISSDAIFDGEKGMYTEDNPPNALTVYGKTKAEGEYYCSNNYNLSIIIRTNVFGRNNFIPKTSFVESLLQNLEKNIPYSAFTDAIFSPIYVEELLEIVLELAQKKSYGTYNVVSSVALTKYEFAKTLAKAFDYDLNLIKESSVTTISQNIKYPKNVSLDNHKISKILNRKIPPLTEMLERFRKELNK